MKNHLMSLVACLGFSLWSSYSTADYVDDQVLKYCKAFMAKYLEADIKNFTYKTTIKKFRNKKSMNPNKTIWMCTLVEQKQNTEKTYIAEITGFQAKKEDSQNSIKAAYSEALSMHTQGHLIEVAGVEYSLEHSPLYVMDNLLPTLFDRSGNYTTYLAITKIFQEK